MLIEGTGVFILKINDFEVELLMQREEISLDVWIMFVIENYNYVCD